MTEVSLSASIFGKKEDEKGGALSDLFSSTSSALPAKPNKVNFTETKLEKTRRERDDEKKKKRKKKNQDEDNGDSVAPLDSKSPEAKTKRKEKKRKTKTDENQEKTETKDNESNNAEEDTENSEDTGMEEYTVFVGNLPLDINRKRLEGLFKDCGKIKSSRLRSFGTTGVKVAPEHAGNQNLVKKVSVNTKQLLKGSVKSTAQGYVVFEKVESVDKALKLNNEVVPNSDGLILRVDRSKPTLDSTRSVFVGNLPYKANEMTLRSHFCDGCGWNNDEEEAIEGVRIVRDKETMQCRGFGYILLKDKSYIPAALNMHESKYMKRELRVLVCGKRFKNRKGAPKEGTKVKLGAHRRVANKPEKDTTKSAKDLIAGTNGKKKRGTKKVGVTKSGNAGISKRVASGKKLDKRTKKIQKRMEKGMGKTKK